MLNNNIEISLPTPVRDTTKTMGPGASLRKIREARHLTLEEISKRIRLSQERLTQLENDDYALMGAPAFAKGYLRTYALQLGVAPEEITNLLQAFGDLNLADGIRHNKLELLNEKMMNQVSPKTTRWTSYLVIIAIVLGVVGYVWHNHTNILNTAANTNNSDKATVDTVVETPPTPLPVDTSAIAVPAQATPVQTTSLPPSITSPNLLDIDGAGTSDTKSSSPLGNPFAPKTSASSPSANSAADQE